MKWFLAVLVLVLSLFALINSEELHVEKSTKLKHAVKPHHTHHAIKKAAIHHAKKHQSEDVQDAEEGGDSDKERQDKASSGGGDDSSASTTQTLTGGPAGPGLLGITTSLN